MVIYLPVVVRLAYLHLWFRVCLLKLVVLNLMRHRVQCHRKEVV